MGESAAPSERREHQAQIQIKYHATRCHTVACPARSSIKYMSYTDDQRTRLFRCRAKGNVTTCPQYVFSWA